jgi:hypothetical protein
MAHSTDLVRRLGSPWAVLLAGPVVGITYFWIVYLLAEASCANGVELLGTSSLRATLLAITAAALVVLGWYAWRARRLWRTEEEPHPTGSGGIGAGAGADDRRENRRFLLVTGVTLLAMFALFALFLAAPLVGGSLCAAP